MNWYAHAVLAERVSPDPACVLGAMLPDLAAALGLRARPPADGALARGMLMHAAADAAFHAAPEFVLRVARGRAALEAEGLARGRAWGAAHVGIELLLDGWLAGRAPRSAAFSAALGLARELAADTALFRPAPDAARWQLLCERLREGELPEGYARPERAAEGVERALARRPRLALARGDRAHVARWLEGERAAIDACGARLLECAAAAPAPR